MYADLKEKVVIITGAGGNLGQAVTRYFHTLGARLVLLDRSLKNMQERYADVLQADWLLLETELTHKPAVEEMVKNTLARFGQIDILINIAGGFAGGLPVHEADEATWDHLLDSNAKSIFITGGVVAKAMIAGGGGGRIINVGAKPGLHGGKNIAAYSAAKAAVLRLTESMAAELKEHNITVNAVLPSTIDTPQNRSADPQADPGKWVTPASLAGVIGFLASASAADISGALVPVYGKS